MSSLADRIREVLKAPDGRPKPDAASSAVPDTTVSATGDLESALGGAWRTVGDTPCFVVETRRHRSSKHGRLTVGEVADRLQEAPDDLSLLAGFPVGQPVLFFDLETTGLSGGAGTYAFLVGCAWFEADGSFATRQYMLARFADERTLLALVAGELARAGALVSFNGRSFDAPLIETRYLYHRLDWAGAGLPHLDMLHVARRFWKRQTGGVELPSPYTPQESGCSLSTLERTHLGHRRRGDVPGIEIPARYFAFVRSGDARPLAPVLEHNRLDLLSLAALTARAVSLVGRGPTSVHGPREALALGWLYARGGHEARARDAYARAVALSAGMPPIHVESLRALALAWRRARQYDEAALCWRRILDVHGCPSQVAHEASDALAIHHEHRVRDLANARRFALQSLEHNRRPAREQAVRHRLDRLDRKLERLASDDEGRLQFAES